MDRYYLNSNQLDWLGQDLDKEDRMRFLIHGPVDAIPVSTSEGVMYAGRLRGVVVTSSVGSLALALKEADQIRKEYIAKVEMIPLDEDSLGIADTPKQRGVAA